MMWYTRRSKNQKYSSGRNVVYYVYDIRTTMIDFCASFAVREHADAWGKLVFGEHAYISDRRLHRNDCVWNGEQR